MTESRKACLVMAVASWAFLPGQAVGMPKDTAGSLPSLRQEQIVALQPSFVMLQGEDLKESQEKWRESFAAVKPAIAVKYMTLSAYNSMENQTDGTPYATAIGSLTRDGVVASNNLPIGTRVRFPDHFGEKEFRVEDRMNARYQNNIDIWMEDHGEAVKFGRRYAKIEIIEWGKGRGMD